MEKTLYAVDELSGFLLACAYVRPEGIVGLTPKSVKKKLKQPSFAAAVNRDEVRHGAEELGVDFDEHVRFVIAALEEHADELGVRGSRRRVSARARYARVLRTPHVLPLMAAALVARLPIGIDSLAIVLFLRDRPAPTRRPAFVSAAFALGSGAGAPLSGRLIDRFGQRGCSSRSRSCTPARSRRSSPSALAAAPTALLLPAALLAGATIPPISATLRPLWGPMLHDDAGPPPHRLRARLGDDRARLRLGPLLTAAATALLSPVAAFALAAALLVGGTVAFASSPPSRAWRPDPARAATAGSARCGRPGCGRSSPRRCRSASASGRWR